MVPLDPVWGSPVLRFGRLSLNLLCYGAQRMDDWDVGNMRGIGVNVHLLDFVFEEWNEEQIVFVDNADLLRQMFGILYFLKLL